jgi:hypothetical protein
LRVVHADGIAFRLVNTAQGISSRLATERSLRIALTDGALDSNAREEYLHRVLAPATDR